ncbi:MAG: peptidylprolyl isomerase [Bacteroidota bacterium]
MKKLLLSAILFFAAFSLQAENPRYKMSVTHGGNPLGDIILEIFADVAPLHAARFDSLVSIGFYNTTAFHRVIPNFMIQGGDINSRTDMDKPRSTWGFGDGSLSPVKAEFSQTLKHLRGTLSAARTNDPNSFTSQFFICVVAKSGLDKNYSIFGKVITGMDVADKIVAVPRDANDNPIQKVEMNVEKFFGTGIQDSTEKDNSEVTISPNPADISSKIRFTLLKDENIKLEILNNLGERVTILHEGNLPRGPQEFTWNTKGNPDGNYFFSLKIGEEVKSGKIVLLRK